MKKLKEYSLEHARDKLIEILGNYRAAVQCDVIVVFDAYLVKDGKERQENYFGVDVFYTSFGQTADSLIEKMVSSFEINNHNVRVVSSDRDEQRIVFGRGAVRVSAMEFLSEVKKLNAEMRNIVNPNSLKTNVKDVISEETRDIMNLWRKS